MAAERQWVVPEDLPDHTDIIPVDREEVLHAFQGAEEILHRLGGVIQIAAQRVEVSDGRFIPVGYVFRHISYAPAQRAQREDNGHEVVDPEPVEA